LKCFKVHTLSLQEIPCFTLEEQFHKFLVTTNAAFEPRTITPNDIAPLRSLHIHRRLSDAGCQLLTSILSSLPALTTLQLDASAAHPADSDYDPTCIDGGGVVEALAAALSSMHWLRRLSLSWPMHGVVPIAAALPALESLQELTLDCPPTGLRACGVSIVARSLSTVTTLQRYAIIGFLFYFFVFSALLQRGVHQCSSSCA
jgi:hypothetical protein